MKRFLSLLLVVLLLSSLTACSNQSFEIEKLGGLHLESGDTYPEDFLRFDGHTVTFSEFRYYYMNYRDMYLAEDPDWFSREGAEEELKNEILDVLRDEWGVRLLAEDHKIRLSRDEINAVQKDVEEIISLNGGEETMNAQLAASYTAKGHFSNMMSWAALTEKLYQYLFYNDGIGEFSDEEIFAYFQENSCAVWQIYLPFEEGENVEKHETTLAKANLLYEKAAKGEDFWELVLTEGKDEAMLEHPDGFYITEGYSLDVLYQKAKTLSVGDVSEPIVTDGGIHILKRLALKEDRIRENTETALYGYTGPDGNRIPGAYDDVYYRLYHERGQSIQIEFSDAWKSVSTKTVY